MPDGGRGLEPMPLDEPGRVVGLPEGEQGLTELLDAVEAVHPEYLIPGFDGALFSLEWKDALWARFSMGAPARQRQSVERYSIVKRA